MFQYYDKRDTMRTLKVNEINYKWDNNTHYKTYLKEVHKPRNIKKTQLNTKGQTEYIYDDGCVERLYNNGAKRFEFPFGYKIVHFENGDIK